MNVDFNNPQIKELFTKPAKWAESFLRNPMDAEQPLVLKSYQKEELEASRDNRRIVLRWGRRLGKCSWKNDKVVLSTGERITVQELYNRYKDGQDLKLITMTDNYSLITSENIKVADNGFKDIYRVQTKSGKLLNITENHPLYTINGWCPLKDITVGDKILIPSKISLETSKEINIDDVKLLGYLLGDGSIVHTISFTNTNEKLIDEFKECCISKHISYVRQDEISYYPVYKSGYKNPIRSMLDKYGLSHENSHTKFIPSIIFELSKQQQAVFLSRLFACDGWACLSKAKNRKRGGEIGYCSVSRELIYGVSHLLLRFGIKHFLTPRNVRYKNTYKKAYAIRISGKNDILKFINEIGIFGKEKQCQSLYEDTIQKKTNGNDYFSRIPRAIYDIINTKGLRTFGIRKKYCPSKHKILEIAKARNNKDLENLCSSDTYFDDIISIENIGVDQTYAIEVPTHHNYIVNDVITHNTVILCADTLWWVSTFPLVELLEGKTKKQRKLKVLIATPYETQIKMIWNTYLSLIGDSPLLKDWLVKVRTSDVHLLEFQNGSSIEGYTIGISSSNKGTSLRGLDANILFIDEMDAIPREIIDEVLMPIWTGHPDCLLRVSSTPTGKRELFYTWCFHESALVNTPEGVKNIKDIGFHDYVFGEDGIPDKVTAKYFQPYNGLLKHIDTPVGPLKCTPNHEIKTIDKLFVKSGDLKVGDYVYVPIQKYNSIKPYSPKLFYEVMDENIPTGPKKKALEFIKNTKASSGLFRLLCFYITNGSVITQGDKKIGIKFSFNSGQKKYAKQCYRYLKQIFSNTFQYLPLQDNKTDIELLLPWSAYLFEELCPSSEKEDAYLNPILLASKHCYAFLKTFIELKGSKNIKSDFDFICESRNLAHQLLQVCYKLDLPIAIAVHPRTENTAEHYICKRIYRNYKKKNGDYYVRIMSMTDLEYSGTVYNFETKRTHTYSVSNICTHNCTRAEDIGWWHRHHPSWHPDNDRWISIDKAKAEGIPITESTEFQVKQNTPSDAYAREYGAEFGEEFGGVYKHHLLNSCLVKYGRNVDITDPDIFAPGFNQNPQHKYIIGVDWNSYVNGGQVVMMEYCTTPTIVTFFDDELNKDVSIDFTGKYRLFYRRGIKSKEATQRKTREEIIRLMRNYKVDFVYVDYGAGDTNIEELTLYGKKYPELQLSRKLRVIDSGATVEHYDHIANQKVKKRNKSLMINFSVLSLEEGLFVLPKEEDQPTRLIGQMRGYQVKNITARGDYSYEGDDHILDAFNLAIYGFQQNFGQLLSQSIIHRMLSLPDPRFNDYPRRIIEPEGNSVINSQRFSGIVDPEKGQYYINKHKPRRTQLPIFGRRSVDFKNPGPIGRRSF